MLRVKKLSPDAELPFRGTPGSAGYDLTSTESHVILPGYRAVVATGLAVEIPDGTYGRIAPRSGLAVKNGIQVGAGVVDSDYRGELKVVLFNHDLNKTFNIKPGYRIAQLILETIQTPEVEEIKESLQQTERGEGGFGSTGVGK
jgi:dUTP pyrophosphatase